MFGLGTWEMVIILAAALIFIGPGKLPELAKTLGKGLREIRRAMAGFEGEVRHTPSVPAAPESEPTDAQGDDDAEPTVAHGERVASARPVAPVVRRSGTSATDRQDDVSPAAVTEPATEPATEPVTEDG